MILELLTARSCVENIPNQFSVGTDSELSRTSRGVQIKARTGDFKVDLRFEAIL